MVGLHDFYVDHVWMIHEAVVISSAFPGPSSYDGYDSSDRYLVSCGGSPVHSPPSPTHPLTFSHFVVSVSNRDFETRHLYILSNRVFGIFYCRRDFWLKFDSLWSVLMTAGLFILINRVPSKSDIAFITIVKIWSNEVLCKTQCDKFSKLFCVYISP